MKKMIMTLFAAAAINATALEVTWTFTEEDVIGTLGIWASDYSLYYSRIQFFFGCNPPTAHSTWETDVHYLLDDGTFNGSGPWAYTEVVSPNADGWTFNFDTGTDASLSVFHVCAVIEVTPYYQTEMMNEPYHQYLYGYMTEIDADRYGVNPNLVTDLWDGYEVDGISFGWFDSRDYPEYNMIPEPATGLLALGGAALLLLRRRRRE